MADDADSQKKRSGQVRHDAGGRAIWEWAVESGKHAIDSTSRLLKRLDLSGLSLLDDEAKHWEKDNPDAPAGKPAVPQQTRPSQPVQRQQSTSALQLEVAKDADQVMPKGGRSFNPYDTRAPARRAATPSARPAVPPRPRITQPVRPTRKPGLLARLFGRGNS